MLIILEGFSISLKVYLHERIEWVIERVLLFILSLIQTTPSRC